MILKVAFIGMVLLRLINPQLAVLQPYKTPVRPCFYHFHRKMELFDGKYLFFLG